MTDSPQDDLILAEGADAPIEALKDKGPMAPPRSKWRDVWDQFRKHKGATAVSPAAGDADASRVWLEHLAEDPAPQPNDRVVQSEDDERQRDILAEILKQHVGELWSAGEFQKLMVLEFLFVLGGRNKDAAARFGIADETTVAGIKYRAVERLRGMARQRDPNHSLFLGLWESGAK